jgi:hypothetical protein
MIMMKMRHSGSKVERHLHQSIMEGLTHESFSGVMKQ